MEGRWRVRRAVVCHRPTASRCSRQAVCLYDCLSTSPGAAELWFGDTDRAGSASCYPNLEDRHGQDAGCGVTDNSCRCALGPE